MTGTNTIIDISHHNGDVNLETARDAGIRAVIAKASNGVGSQDSKFTINRAKASAAGLLFGAYHFGTGSDGAAQADFFLTVLGPTRPDILVLDFEKNPLGTTMTLDGARAFVKRIIEKTGKPPGLYAGSFLKEILGSSSDPVLKQCWFWLAQYKAPPVIPANWAKWTMWQYTDGEHGPEPVPVPGVGKCDRDTFNGTAEQLEAFWTGAAAATAAAAGPAIIT